MKMNEQSEIKFQETRKGQKQKLKFNFKLFGILKIWKRKGNGYKYKSIMLISNRPKNTLPC